jgi:hypothetical protein
MQLQYIKKIREDSVQLSFLNQQLSTQRMEWERRDSLSRTQSSGYTLTQKQFDSVNRVAQAAQTEIASLNSQLAQLQRNYDELKARPTPSKERADPPETGSRATGFDAAADTNSIRLNLAYNDPKKAIEKSLKIYLIPLNASNKRLIKQANADSYYKNYNQSILSSAAGAKLAQYDKGSYVFLNVDPGSYQIIVCVYNGNTFEYKKPVSGNTIVKKDVAPPNND